MSKFTLDDKIKYNLNKKTDFSAGYVVGAGCYRDYKKSDYKNRKAISGLIYENSRKSKGDRRRSDVQYANGFMCGVRDAANERKKKK